MLFFLLVLNAFVHITLGCKQAVVDKNPFQSENLAAKLETSDNETYMILRYTSNPEDTSIESVFETLKLKMMKKNPCQYDSSEPRFDGGTFVTTYCFLDNLMVKIKSKAFGEINVKIDETLEIPPGRSDIRVPWWLEDDLFMPRLFPTDISRTYARSSYGRSYEIGYLKY